jgi:hypothetical protein
MITDNPEVSRRFEEIHSKMLNKEFVSAGTLLRFRDVCIMTGYNKAREEELKFLKEVEKQELLLESIDMVTERIEELKR